VLAAPSASSRAVLQGGCSLPRAAAARCRPPLPRSWWSDRGRRVLGVSAMVRGEPGVGRDVRPPPECLPAIMRSLLFRRCLAFLLTRSLPHLHSRVRGREQVGRVLLRGALSCTSSLAASGEHPCAMSRSHFERAREGPSERARFSSRRARERSGEGEREGAPCLGARPSVSSAVASTLRVVEGVRL
jgi:hypothetical protein